MDEVLKEMAESKKLAVSLKHVHYSDQLYDQLLKHSSHLEQLYGAYQKLASKNDTKDSKYENLMSLAKEKMGWFEKSKAWWCLQKSYLNMSLYVYTRKCVG